MKKKYIKIREHFCEHDPVMYELFNQTDIDSWRGRPSGKDYFSFLMRAIIGQQLSVKAARTINERVLTLFEGEQLSAEGLLEVREEDLRAAGLSRSKARYVRDLSEKVISGEVNFSEIEKLSDEEIYKRLTIVAGIGPWTVEMFLMTAMGREDVFSYGDAGLRRAINMHYGNGRKLSDREVASVSEKWRPYRSFASFALWESLDNGKPLGEEPENNKG